MAKTILIVGASRGLGLGLARAYLAEGWNVIATSRGNDAGLRELEAGARGRLRCETLDVTDEAGLADLARGLDGVGLDILFACAGIMSHRDEAAAEVDAEAFAHILVTNALAPMKVIGALGDRVARHGTIVAMTSVLGSVGGNANGGCEIYRASKAALNSLLRSYSARHPERAVVAMHPGWVRTDMGGANAAVSIQDSARGMVAAVAAHAGKPGCVFIDYRGRTIPW